MNAPARPPLAAADLAMLRRIPAFARLPEPMLIALAGTCPVRHFAPGAALLKQNGRGDHALALLSGEVEIVHDARHGREPRARLAGPTLVGEVGALANLRRNASVVAVTAVRALRIERGQLCDLGRLAPDALLTVIGDLGRQIHGLNGALGLYAAGCEALGEDSLDPAILESLSHPAPALQSFATAFGKLAHTIARERKSRAEMASAALLQRAMLPSADAGLPPCGRCDIAGLMEPARNVGGDFFDIFMLDDDHVALIIGDVCGKGVPACLFMSVTLTMLRLAARDASHGGPEDAGARLAAMIGRVNDMICEQNASAMFATALYGVLDLRDGRFDYVNCGHEPPFVLRRAGTLTREPNGGVPLGVVPGKRFAARALDLAPGDGLFLFTDGINESTGPGGEQFGDARLAETLHRLAGAGAAAALVAGVAAEVTRFAGVAEPFDDITCLAAIRPAG